MISSWRASPPRSLAFVLLALSLLLPDSADARARDKHPHAKTAHFQSTQRHPSPSASRHAANRAAPAKSAKQAATKPLLPLVVVDAGHGGRDPGAIGISGTREKDVTLATARELQQQLVGTGRYRVALTRTRDITVPLANRVAFARENGAALFISIHADASTDRSAQGASVYTKSSAPTGSKVRELAARADNSGAIAHALSGNARRPAPGSNWLQFSLIDSLDDDIRMLREPARRAHFYVLGFLDIPSVLLEMGFLTNRSDETLLRQPTHRRVIARAIRDAVEEYFEEIRQGDAART